MKHWLFLLLAVAAEVIGTTALKASDSFTRLWPSLTVALAFACAFYFLTLALKTIPVGVAYAVWSGLGIVLISIIGRIVFDQRLDAPAIIGIGFILAGVLIMQIFSKAVAH